jgi:hypothetical protein
MRARHLAAAGAMTLLLAGGVRADVVIDWDNVLLAAVRVDRTAPPRAARAMARVHVATFDAVNGIVGGYTPYHVTAGAPPGASAEAAAAAAAHDALVALFPAQQATFDAALVASLAAVPDGAAETSGVEWGKSVAAEILALRAGDHSGDVVTPGFPAGGGWWLPTAPAFAAALLPQWPSVTPWCLKSGSELRGPAPPALGSVEYTRSFREVKLLGRVDSHDRTADQTQIALFWADGPGTATPPGHWLLIAQGVSQAQQLSLAANARLFALLGLAVADAGILSWDQKYYYNNWRPITGIQNADSDGNPKTASDPGWTPLIATPPFPSYTSGHSTFSGSSARLLELFFGTDQQSFSTTSDGLPGVTRSFTTFSAAAEEAGQSRIYGGIHWQYDNQVGLATGRTLAEHVFFNFLTPVAAPSTCSANATTLCLGDGRFEVRATWNTGTAGGPAKVAGQSGDSGQFYFFDADNTELTVKLLDACAYNDRFWVFASGLTNVEVRVTVTDTQAGKVRQYFNPRGKVFAPVQDVGAFETCQ